jgi:hypothetical protein
MFWYLFNSCARHTPLSTQPLPDISPSMLVFGVMLQSTRANAFKAQSTSLKPSRHDITVFAHCEYVMKYGKNGLCLNPDTTTTVLHQYKQTL